MDFGLRVVLLNKIKRKLKTITISTIWISWEEIYIENETAESQNMENIPGVSGVAVVAGSGVVANNTNAIFKFVWILMGEIIDQLLKMNEIKYEINRRNLILCLSWSCGDQ